MHDQKLTVNKFTTGPEYIPTENILDTNSRNSNQ
jgi:hypothetical protein